MGHQSLLSGMAMAHATHQPAGATPPGTPAIRPKSKEPKTKSKSDE